MTEFEVDDLVQIGEEKELGVVVLPTGHALETVPDDLPDLDGLCCTPIALIRSVADGWMRWVPVADLTAVEPRQAGGEASRNSDTKPRQQ